MNELTAHMVFIFSLREKKRRSGKADRAGTPAICARRTKRLPAAAGVPVGGVR